LPQKLSNIQNNAEIQSLFYAEPIKPIMLRLGEVLSKRYNNTMLFRMESEVPPVQPIRLKVEINCYEHFNVQGPSASLA